MLHVVEEVVTVSSPQAATTTMSPKAVTYFFSHRLYPIGVIYLKDPTNFSLQFQMPKIKPQSFVRFFKKVHHISRQ
jgi:hypothetical protein